MKMNREEWIAEADRILQEDYNFDPKFITPIKRIKAPGRRIMHKGTSDIDVSEKQRLKQIMEKASYGIVMLTCGSCGHVDEVQKFSESVINGPLPHDIYQCPVCGTAIKRIIEGGRITHKVIPSIL